MMRNFNGLFRHLGKLECKIDPPKVVTLSDYIAGVVPLPDDEEIANDPQYSELAEYLALPDDDGLSSWERAERDCPIEAAIREVGSRQCGLKELPGDGPPASP